MDKGATYASDCKPGKIYRWNMGEIQVDKDGKFWFYNTSSCSVHGCPAGGIMQINPHPSSIFYYDRDIEK